VITVRRRLSPSYRRILDIEAARIRRRDAVDAFAAAAADLGALRQSDSTDPVVFVVAESRLETARNRFWAADADYRRLSPADSAVS
jgi:hypothetical protein